MDKNIPLSELIRIGSKLSGQAFGTICEKDKTTCALGAAWAAKFGMFPPAERGTMHTAQDLGILSTHVEVKESIPDAACPGRWSLHELITRLNDRLQWTREQIADWLEEHGL